jgi:hypothetical protein
MLLAQWYKQLTGWFLKDSRLVIKPGSHDAAVYDVPMLTVVPMETYRFRMHKDTPENQWPQAIGTYGAVWPGSVFEPFNTVVWLLIEQQFGLKDVMAQVSAPGFNDILIMANNPTVGYPYIIIVDCEAMKVGRFNLSEKEEQVWQDHTGRNFIVRRNSDSDYKEFIVTVDP